MGLRDFIGIAAGVLSFAACPIYLLGIWRNETRPDRVAWWILALCSLLLVATNWSIGSRATLWLPIAYCASFLVVAVVSLRYGEGPARLHAIDRICLAATLASVVLWWFFQSAAVGLYVCIAAEFAGLLPTITKAYSRPWTEDRWAWSLAFVASALNLFALTSWHTQQVAYPLYVFVTNFAIAALVLRPTRGQTRAAA